MSIILSLCFIPSILLNGKRQLHALQQNFYNENNRYLKWVFTKKNLFAWFSILFVFINLVNLFLQNSSLSLFNLLIIVYFFYDYQKSKQEQVKIPLHVTSRLKRLIATLCIIFIILFCICIFCFSSFSLLFFVSLFLGFEFFFVFLSNVINKPIEAYVFHYYKKKAMRKLSSMSHMDVIGITGSYGKTSSKNILNTVLGVKFNTFATPKNYNTQYGLILTINNYLDKFEDYFIAEMGAFKRGRIKLLCDLVRPKYGILTTIGLAHLETFGSRENIQKGKFELIESLPKDGVGVLNMDDPYQVSYSLSNECSIIWIGIQNEKADVRATNIQMNQDGMKFDVFFQKEKKTVTFETKLLGEANVYNILAAVALGHYLGESFEELILGVKKIETIPHRLELKKAGTMTIIDDSYNSNPVGSKMALDVLSMMDGLKVVVTPGMIELGEKQDEYNKQFGKYISEVADYVILVGKEQTKPILDGLLENHYNHDKIKVINDVKQAFPLAESLKEPDRQIYLLLENDLPDIYNE